MQWSAPVHGPRTYLGSGCQEQVDCLRAEASRLVQRGPAGRIPAIDIRSVLQQNNRDCTSVVVIEVRHLIQRLHQRCLEARTPGVVIDIVPRGQQPTNSYDVFPPNRVAQRALDLIRSHKSHPAAAQTEAHGSAADTATHFQLNA